MALYQRELGEEFSHNYFSPNLQKRIACQILKDLETEDDGELSKRELLKSIKDSYYDIYSYLDLLFSDDDFNFLDIIYNNRDLGYTHIENRLRIDIDEYFSLLPQDIQKKFPTQCITLKTEILKLIMFIQNRFLYGNLWKLFWLNSKFITIKKIQIILDDLITAYFAKKEIELYWYSSIKNDCLCFQFFKRFHHDRVLMVILPTTELNKINNDSRQKYISLLDEYDSVFIIFIVKSNQEYQKVKLDNTTYFYKNIFDLRPKKSASKLH